jgi:hypothetical protein
MPPGSRAIQAWTVRFESQVLDAFGRPDPNQDPPCERLGQTTVVQALHLMNSPNIERKISDDKGRARLLADAVARGQKKAEDVVRELYLRAYCRLPSAEETAKSLRLLETIEGAKLSRREWVEDLMWALLNSPEFVFKD